MRDAPDHTKSPRRRGRARTALRIACPAALVCTLVAIWMLTVQTPTETTSLSSGVTKLIAQVAGLSESDAFIVARKLVHTVEFFPVGFFLALAAIAWDGSAISDAKHRRRLLAGVIVACLACSFADQLHKAVVPGREFDALDMLFDAAGYLLGTWLAMCLAARGDAR